MKKSFVMSYSGGKDSALALYRALQMGMKPVCLLVTYNTGMGRSWFHGIPEPVLEHISHALQIPVCLVRTDGSDYNQRFREELKKQKAEVCVFGDIDIAEHLQWGRDICSSAGIEACFPLQQEKRENLVREFIRLGFRASLTVVDLRRLSEKHLGMVLTESEMASIAAEGADVCGENGEYHSFVWDGPIFQHPVPILFGEKQIRGEYAVLPVLPDTQKGGISVGN